MSLRFPTVKLLDYWVRWAELEESSNPFAMVVMAHLEAQRMAAMDVWAYREW